MGLGVGLSDRRRGRLALAGALAANLQPSAKPSARQRRRAGLDRARSARTDDTPAMARRDQISSGLGVRTREIYHRPNLVVLSLLDRLVSRFQIRHQALAAQPAAGGDLPRGRHRQRRRGMEFIAADQTPLVDPSVAEDGHAYLRPPRPSRCLPPPY